MHRPEDPGRMWGRPIVHASPEGQDLRLVGFFDWYQLAPRDFRLLEVRIDSMPARPELTGHHALVELAECSLYYVEPEGLA